MICELQKFDNETNIKRVNPRKTNQKITRNKALPCYKIKSENIMKAEQFLTDAKIVGTHILLQNMYNYKKFQTQGNSI